MLKGIPKIIKNKYEPITEGVIKSHLLELGYSTDALSPSVMQEFISELQDLYESGALEEELEYEESADSDEDQEVEFESIRNNTIISGNIIKHDYEKTSSNSDKYHWKTPSLDQMEKCVTISSEPGHDMDDYLKENAPDADLQEVFSKLNLQNFHRTVDLQRKKTMSRLSSPSASYDGEYSDSFEDKVFFDSLIKSEPARCFNYFTTLNSYLQSSKTTWFH
jgi:hypothetical protein